MEEKIRPTIEKAPHRVPKVLRKAMDYAMLSKTLTLREKGGIDEGTAIFLALVAVTAMTVFTLYKQLERGNTTIPFLQ